MVKKIVRSGFPIIVLLLTIGLAHPVWALESGGIGVIPANPDPNNLLSKSWFIYEVDPGAVIHDAALVFNTSSKPLTAKVEGLDGSLSSDGGFGLADNASMNQDLGSWITLDKSDVPLKASSQEKVGFTIVVPKDAEVGDHYGGIVVSREAAAPSATMKMSGGSTVSIVTRVGARIYLTVKGDIVRGLKVLHKGYSYPRGQLRLSFNIKDTGNVRADIKADVSIYGVFGLWDRQTLPLGQVTPKVAMNKEVVWPNDKLKAPFFGPYLALMTIRDTQEIKNTTPPAPIKTVLFMFFVPWASIIVILVLAFLFWLIWQFMVWRRLAKLAKAKVVAYQVKRGETLPEIAARYGLGWKFVAAINELKPPYVLKEGHRIYLPDAGGERRQGIRTPNYFTVLARPFAVFGAWLLGRVFRIDRFRKVSGAKTRHSELVSESKLPAASRALPAPQWLTAIVEPGDTLRKIADYFKVPSKTIIELNNLKFPFRLQPGDELKIPSKAEGLKIPRSNNEKRRKNK